MQSKRKPPSEAKMEAAAEEVAQAAARLVEADEGVAARHAECEAISRAKAEVAEARESIQRTKKIVYRIADSLLANGYTEVRPVARARTAVVNCFDPRAGMHVDVVVHNMLANHNTALLRTYLSVSPRFKQLALLVKAWAKARGVANAGGGTLSPYDGGHFWCSAARRSELRRRALLL
jgi:hypothetical protein